MKKVLLLVEDELHILKNNRNFFESEGYSVLTAETLTEARELLKKETPGAIVLDIMLPDGNGLDLLRELREAGNKTPVIMLTAWGKPSDVAKGLKLGANDYIPKPFAYEELLARVETMFRNVEQVPEAISKGRLTLRIRPMEVRFANQTFKLPPIEFFLLQFFMENEGRIISVEFLYEQVWGQPMNEDSKAVKTAVSRLRTKLTDSGFIISYDKQKNGYRFEKEL